MELQPHGLDHWSNSAHQPSIAGICAWVAIPWVVAFFASSWAFFWIALALTALAIYVQGILRMSFASAGRALRIMITGRIKHTRNDLRTIISR